MHLTWSFTLVSTHQFVSPNFLSKITEGTEVNDDCKMYLHVKVIVTHTATKIYVVNFLKETRGPRLSYIWNIPVQC